MEEASGNLSVAEQELKTTRFEIIAESDRYREARQRLADRTAAIELRLVARLHDVQEQHDLSWRLLLSSQRKISKAGFVVPTPLEFWATDAAPKAAALATAARLVIDSEVDNAASAVSRFSESVSPLLTTPGLETLARTDVSVVLLALASAGLDDEPINSLGERWQQRLHRQATRRCLRARVTGSSPPFDQLVATEELAMLDQAPWIHGDRLLSAFEIAHSETRAHLRSRVAAVSMIVAGRAASQVDIII